MTTLNRVSDTERITFILIHKLLHTNCSTVICLLGIPGDGAIIVAVMPSFNIRTRRILLPL